LAPHGSKDYKKDVGTWSVRGSTILNSPANQQHPNRMNSERLAITYIGGPSCLLEFGGVRFLTDPTFDPAGGEYTTGPVTLRKLVGPGLSAASITFDYVLLSHDHHADNLDHAGQKALARAKKVFTTSEGAARLGGNSQALQDWEAIDVPANGRTLRIVATPARHGPEGRQRGAVNGFVLFLTDAPDQAVYISGDTVWYEGIPEIAKRFSVRAALLHLGAARVEVVGPYHLTMTAAEGVQAAQIFLQAGIVPIHFEDWAHFSEGKMEIEKEFNAAGLTSRLRWPERGREIQIELKAA
jgi:L-ascorbate metabolism protein UlaG (beta-lactamase superfamily)